MTLVPPIRYKHLADALRAARLAGTETLRWHRQPLQVDYKADESPVTAADHAAHQAIMTALAPSGLPVVSEEGREQHIHSGDADLFWLVDPLDGTKEFIRQRNDFTVNIALVEGDRPVLGVVGVPALDIVYAGAIGIGAFRGRGEAMRVLEEDPEAIHQCERLPLTGLAAEPLRVVASRSHRTEETNAFIARLEADSGKVETVARGSAIKLCLVATGEAHWYPRLAPTMAWDTAAAQAVVEAAGGTVITLDRERYHAFLEAGPTALVGAPPLRVTDTTRKNPWFVVKAKASSLM